MGYRLYSAKVYNVKFDYEHTGFFNLLQEEMNRLIFDNCESACCYCDDRIYADLIEVDRDDFFNLIEKVKNDIDGCWTKFCNEFTEAGKDYSHQDVIDMLTDLLKHSDPDIDFIVLRWA